MTFMGAYKHLDNLCRDMNGKGISGYIEDMSVTVVLPIVWPIGKMIIKN